MSRAELTPEYGFPAGWSVLPAVFVNTAKEIYGLRFICAPDSKLYDTLKKGIDEDALPVITVAGLFFKNYARKTGDTKEPPWVRPLLVCPEPEFPGNVQPRHVLKELQEAGYGHLLPSQRVAAPGAEERLVLEIVRTETSEAVRAWGENASSNPARFIAMAVDRLKKRLPAEQSGSPAAVVLLPSPPPDEARVQKITDALKAAGVTRIALKKSLGPAKSETGNPGK
jgi:hypothetical protein